MGRDRSEAPVADTVMGNEWFYTQNGRAAPAPVSPEQLKQLAGGGLLRPDDLVWKEGMPNWVPAASLKGLFPPTKQPSGELPVLAAAPPVPAANGAAQAKAAPAAKGEEGGLAAMHPALVLAL